jgi:hypothetical protein
MKILFLDIDGVINNRKTCLEPNEFWPIDKYMAFLVGRLVDRVDAKIVLSSSWRHHPDGIKEIEKRVGKVFDSTKTFSNTRGEEIKEWLDRHPEVTKYAILDDDSDMLPEQLPNFFKTSFSIGLTDEIINKVEEHLK